MLLLSHWLSTLSLLHCPCWDLGWMNCNCNMSNCFLNNSHFFCTRFPTQSWVLASFPSRSFSCLCYHKLFLPLEVKVQVIHIVAYNEKLFIFQKNIANLYGYIHQNTLQYFYFYKTSTEPKLIVFLHLLFYIVNLWSLDQVCSIYEDGLIS